MALLDATIGCLVQEGYAAMTTRSIAKRAGVSPGAQQHHFASKAELVAAALNYLAANISQELLRQAPPARDLRERVAGTIDGMWEMHQGPLFEATMELWVAARTDRELRSCLLVVQREAADRGAKVGALLFPELAGRADFAQRWVTCLATIRGLALLAFLDSVPVEEMWPATRLHLLAVLTGTHAETELV